MSYNAPQGRPGPSYGYGPPPGPPPPRPVARRQRQSGGGGCLPFVLGFLTAVIIGGAVVAFLYFYNPNGNNPLPRPSNAPGTPDISATLSQQYINNEISRQLKSQPFKAGTVTLNDVTITVQNNAQVDIALRANYNGLANFDLTVTEQLTVQNGLIKLTVVGQPKLTNGQLPPGVDGILQQINTQFIEPKLNQQVTQIAINQRNLKLVGLTSTPGLLTVQANVQ